MKKSIGIVIGSDSDLEYAKDTIKVLNDFGIKYEFALASAHRTPSKVYNFVKNCEKNKIEVIIALAGASAALPGVVASHTCIPVIGVPLPTTHLKGEDALLSIVQMPSGIPVATVAIAGTTNAALLAIEILAVKYPEFKSKLANYRKKLIKKIEEKDKNIQKKII